MSEASADGEDAGESDAYVPLIDRDREAVLADMEALILGVVPTGRKFDLNDCEAELAVTGALRITHPEEGLVDVLWPERCFSAADLAFDLMSFEYWSSERPEANEDDIGAPREERGWGYQ